MIFLGIPKMKASKNPRLKNEDFGTPEGIRTPDLLVRSQTLYPTELRVQVYMELNHYSNIKMVASGGIEPPTQGFSVPCSTD